MHGDMQIDLRYTMTMIIHVAQDTAGCHFCHFRAPQNLDNSDSIVRRAKERAAATHQLQLGTPYTIQWHGRGGARLEDVERMANNGLRYSAPPSIMILHLGTNNIGQMDACSCRAAIKTALSTLRARMPQALCGLRSSPA